MIVHVHDIFLPYDYLPEWTDLKEPRQYTEQWVLAAFLHNNKDWEIMWPTYYMNFNKKLGVKVRNNGGSFWFRRV